ncbi:MAG: Rho termination factor N-terminal domain-containing protein [Desulfobacteraceae bacterium]|jgi:hypothetical protein
MEEETKTEETQEEEVKEEAAAETVEETADSAPEAPEDEKPLEKMTSPELKEVAKNIPGVTGVTAMKKDELIALIKKYRGIEDEEPKKVESSKIADLKKKIVDLKAAKAAAQEGKNKKEVDILRRRINRLKKMTRKAG